MIFNDAKIIAIKNSLDGISFLPILIVIFVEKMS